jgi:hypothetical protein
MIFGFNTDVRHGDTVYHVQSEARQGEQLLQTQVFVQGRCIGKLTSNYSSRLTEQGFGDAQIEQLLRDQHRILLEAIRADKVKSVLDQLEPEVLANVRPLDLEWVNAYNAYPESELLMSLRVTDGSDAAAGARLTSRISRPQRDPLYTQGVTGGDGTVEMKIPIDDTLLAETSVLIQANYQGRTTTRKFELRRVG